ncbi:tRNA (adenosine(37)-N6)-threonylcarbamoyltransferase complex ATPase subunit type 1 TsaE [Candidatus Wolfebacteria bacterium RBG_13_41_7]|uniref:tRNA threonylcarbamoyladenosine biosynthesis protein TsaE n=1 Tax=Candidatus Wolfebacteria bacterium RBG_13_41_7 TaxID=1802554 RepID=A0A1F8DKB6_9BACT|nr:MAG: tRNA (adenosine(37)-N6)-threonylcarbamoyltransferase complex ATPase subunit type 1 TsaE [Candidatus Wolfebacteria bacterium RBG_13_41_7]
MKFKTNSLTQTKKIAKLLAKEITTKKSDRSRPIYLSDSETGRRTPTAVGEKNALILALVGDLGSGKTTFTQGFLRGLGIKNKITSPTFVIVKKYKIPSFADTTAGRQNTKYKYAYHFDFYRIRKPVELFSLGFKEVLADPRNIVLIEWPEIVKKVLPKNSIWINFEHGEKENKRIINFRNV